MEKSIDVQAILALHDELIVDWKASKKSFDMQETDLFAKIFKNHAFNYQLWHAEDKARREDMGHSFVYHAKRAIDGYNQKRNDCMELIDDCVIALLRPAAPEACPVHSETPGMMIDRLSILALKHYHMADQVMRKDVDDAHRKKCFVKQNIIFAQREQLARCLQDLLEEVAQQKRTFRTYKQFKMYNAVELNPELYSSVKCE